MEDVNTSQRLSSSLSELRYSRLEFISRKIANIWRIVYDRIGDKVWSSATSLFKWRFRSCCRRCWLSSLKSLIRLWFRIPGKKCCSTEDRFYSLIGSSALLFLSLLSGAKQSTASCDNMKNVHMTHGKRLRSDGKEMYQNAWCTCLAVVLLVYTLPSSSSDFKGELKQRRRWG